MTSYFYGDERTRQVFSHAGSSRHSVVNHEFAITAPLDLQGRDSFDGGTVLGQLALQFNRIDSIGTRTRQVQGFRSDLQILPSCHAAIAATVAAPNGDFIHKTRFIGFFPNSRSAIHDCYFAYVY